MSVRRTDKLISWALWVSIAISLVVMIGVAAHKNVYSLDLHYTVAVCLLWVPPALALGQLDETPGPQSPWFYRFAILTVLWGAAVAAYGFFLLDAN